MHEGAIVAGMAYRGPLTTLMRRVLKASLPEPDYAKTQTAPPDLVDVSSMNSIGVEYVARKGDDSIGTTAQLDLQLVDVTAIMDGVNATGTTFVKAGETDLAVGVGDGLKYDVAASTRVTVRIVAATLHADVTHIDIYWNGLD